MTTILDTLTDDEPLTVPLNVVVPAPPSTTLRVAAVPVDMSKLPLITTFVAEPVSSALLMLPVSAPAPNVSVAEPEPEWFTRRICPRLRNPSE